MVLRSLGVPGRRCVPSMSSLCWSSLLPKKGAPPHDFWENAPRQQTWSSWRAIICCRAVQLLSNFMFLVDFISFCKENFNIRLQGWFIYINKNFVFPQSASGDLMIRNIQLKHSGKYVCMVKTEVDSVASAADLIVRGTSQPSSSITFSTFFHITDHGNN